VPDTRNVAASGVRHFFAKKYYCNVTFVIPCT
jgi:hypothetical protein